MDTALPTLVVDGAAPLPLDREVTTVGRGPGVDIRIDDPTVSRLHAELVRRGPYVYVADLGLSRNGTLVNGRPVARAVVGPRDVISFGSARALVRGVPDDGDEPLSIAAAVAPDLTRRERDVLEALCLPATGDSAFASPASTRDIASRLVVTPAAIKQHLLRLYQKFGIDEGAERRTRLANEAVACGIVQPAVQGQHRQRRAG